MPSRLLRHTIPMLEARLLKAVLGHAALKKTISCGFSGGRDSTVLLHVLAALRDSLPDLHLTAVHINHGLSPHAQMWATHCEQVCAALAVPLQTCPVVVPFEAGDSLEENARKARYTAFSTLSAPTIALAHHQDDLAETVLLQLLRGAGPAGLAGMAAWQTRGKKTLWRPLLNESANTIARYAKTRKLEWIDDESNASTRFKRNWLRHRVMPEIAQHNPGYSAALARAARLGAEAAELIQALGQLDLAALVSPEKPHELGISSLLLLGESRARNALRAWFSALGLRAPAAAKLAELIKQLQESTHDTALLWTHEGVEFTRKKQRLVARQAAPRVAK
jgi:tRNA(Ile)-lysidine synthase